MGRIHWIGVDGTETVEEATEEPSLEKMQDFVGGYIELIPIVYDGRRASMYVDEEANFKNGAEKNVRATEIVEETSRATGYPLRPGFRGIFGSAIILEGIHPV